MRNRERKTTKGSFSEADMREAVALAESGLSIRKAAEMRNVHFVTLSRYVKKNKPILSKMAQKLCTALIIM